MALKFVSSFVGRTLFEVEDIRRLSLYATLRPDDLKDLKYYLPITGNSWFLRCLTVYSILCSSWTIKSVRQESSLSSSDSVDDPSSWIVLSAQYCRCFDCVKSSCNEILVWTFLASAFSELSPKYLRSFRSSGRSVAYRESRRIDT
jgi:hypothetical protein